MQTVTFSGASDDLVHVNGFDGKYDEIGIYKDTPHIAGFKIKSGNMEMTVDVIYRGTWAFAVTGDDGTCDALPPWEIKRTFGDICGYSETLTIAVPDDATIEMIY